MDQARDLPVANKKKEPKKKQTYRRERAAGERPGIRFTGRIETSDSRAYDIAAWINWSYILL